MKEVGLAVDVCKVLDGLRACLDLADLHDVVDELGLAVYETLLRLVDGLDLRRVLDHCLELGLVVLASRHHLVCPLLLSQRFLKHFLQIKLLRLQLLSEVWTVELLLKAIVFGLKGLNVVRDFALEVFEDLLLECEHFFELCVVVLRIDQVFLRLRLLLLQMLVLSFDSF